VRQQDARRPTQPLVGANEGRPRRGAPVGQPVSRARLHRGTGRRRRPRGGRGRPVELRAVRCDLRQRWASHTTRRRLRPRVLDYLIRSLAGILRRSERANYVAVRSRSGGGVEGSCQRRKLLSYFSWYAFAWSTIEVKLDSNASQSSASMFACSVATSPPMKA